MHKINHRQMMKMVRCSRRFAEKQSKRLVSLRRKKTFLSFFAQIKPINVSVEGVQAGGEEEEGEGAQGGAHLGVQDGPQDRVRRCRGEGDDDHHHHHDHAAGASQGERVQGDEEAGVQGDHQAGVRDCS